MLFAPVTGMRQISSFHKILKTFIQLSRWAHDSLTLFRFPTTQSELDVVDWQRWLYAPGMPPVENKCVLHVVKFECAGAIVLLLFCYACTCVSMFSLFCVQSMLVNSASTALSPSYQDMLRVPILPHTHSSSFALLIFFFIPRIDMKLANGAHALADEWLNMPDAALAATSRRGAVKIVCVFV